MYQININKILFLAHMEKVGAKNATPTKSLECSSMTHKESEDLGN